MGNLGILIFSSSVLEKEENIRVLNMRKKIIQSITHERKLVRY